MRRIRRNQNEYNYSRTHERIGGGWRSISYIEYSVGDEIYMRCKEGARCYMALGNVPMMLNKLYATINSEGKKYNEK